MGVVLGEWHCTYTVLMLENQGNLTIFQELVNAPDREESAPMISSEEPAEDFVYRESEENVYTHLGKQVKPV